MILEYPQKDNGMYILRKEQMDDIATMLLQEYSPEALQCAKPVSIEALAEDGLCLAVEYKHLPLKAESLG
jgi:hypothetical protein